MRIPAKGVVLALLVAGALAILASGCGGGDGGGSGSATTQASKPEPNPKPAEPQPASDSGASQAKLWFTAGEQFHPVDRELPPGGSTAPEAVKALRAAPEPGAGPDGVPAETQIPPGVSL